MSVTDPPASQYMADLDAAQEMIDKARVTPVPEGARAHFHLRLCLPHEDAVDLVASEWKTKAELTKDHRQYLAEDPGEPALTVACHPAALRAVTA